MRKLPKEQHKKRIVFLISPEQFELLTETRCKEVSKTAILKEYKKQMRS